MKILITGGMGTLGAPLAAELRKRGHNVWVCDLQNQNEINYIRADVSVYRQLDEVLSYGFDYVYHLAAEFGRNNGEHYYEALWRTNVIGTRNVLELQKHYGFKLIFASSSEIYGEGFNRELHEGLSDTYPLKQPNDYAITKWVNEQQIMNFEKRYGIEAVRCRFFNAYGPGELYHDYRSVVCLFCYRALTGQSWEVYQNYHRVFMYITDFIPTLANVCENFKAGEVYNIGGVEYRSIRELSDLILEITGANPKLVTYLPVDAHNTVNKRPNIDKARRDLGHNPMVMLEEGVPATIEWMRKYYGI